MTTLATSLMSSTFATTFALFGLQLPQKNLFSEISTESNPGPGFKTVDPGKSPGNGMGVAVSFPI